MITKPFECDLLDEFIESLEKSGCMKSTLNKYRCDVQKLLKFMGEREISQELADDFRDFAVENYSVRSAKCMISAVNKYFEFLNLNVKIKSPELVVPVNTNSENSLSNAEYSRLLSAAKKSDDKLYLIIETICSSGIHVSELRYITVQAAKSGKAVVTSGKKSRNVILPKALCSHLTDYCEENGITSGIIFSTKSGKPIDRSNLYRSIRSLCTAADVDESKLFPRNLRNLYNSTRESMEREIVERMGLA